MMNRGTKAACVCGRVQEHCVFCGSAVLYATVKSNRVQHQKDGDDIIIRAFRCRRCGRTFLEDYPCAAPVRASGAAVRGKSALDKAVAKADPRRLDEARQALAALLKARATGAKLDPAEFPTSGEPQSETVKALEGQEVQEPEETGDLTKFPYNDLGHDGFFDRRRK